MHTSAQCLTLTHSLTDSPTWSCCRSKLKWSHSRASNCWSINGSLFNRLHSGARREACKEEDMVWLRDGCSLHTHTHAHTHTYALWSNKAASGLFGYNQYFSETISICFFNCYICIFFFYSLRCHDSSCFTFFVLMSEIPRRASKF